MLFSCVKTSFSVLWKPAVFEILQLYQTKKKPEESKAQREKNTKAEQVKQQK